MNYLGGLIDRLISRISRNDEELRVGRVLARSDSNLLQIARILAESSPTFAGNGIGFLETVREGLSRWRSAHRGPNKTKK